MMDVDDSWVKGVCRSWQLKSTEKHKSTIHTIRDRLSLMGLRAGMEKRRGTRLELGTEADICWRACKCMSKKSNPK